jgi:hypothetical protein
MSVIPLLVKAGQNNHGRTLEALQVKELLETLAAQQNTITNLDGRLQALMLLSNVMLQRLGGKASFPAVELSEAETNGGFEVAWKEDTDVIELRLTPVVLSQVPVEDESAESSEPSVAQVPEGSDAGEVLAADDGDE